MGVVMSKRSRRQFSTGFRAETVRLLETSDKTRTAIARNLDLSISAIRNRVKQARMDNGQRLGEITATQ
jgi:transposase